jgi:protein-tyrosine phosphatase
MVQIEPFPLWLGHAGDCRDVARLGDSGIEAVVQLAVEEPPAGLPRGLLLLRIPLHDGAGNRAALLRLAVESVAGLLRDHIPTLVCCGAGASRSPAVAALALAVVQRKTPHECLQLICDFRKTDVSPGLWQDLLGLSRTT